MVGIFQLFGISFFFWIIVGCLRFIFDTLRILRELPIAASRTTILTATMAGAILSTSLFFLVFLSFGFQESLLIEAAVSAVHFSTLILWLAAVGVSAYIAARISVHQPYLVSFGVGIGSSALTLLILMYSPSTGIGLVPEDSTLAALLAGATAGAGLLGGHIARSLNALERERESARRRAAKGARILPEEVAVVIAAHNEEESINQTIRSLLEITPASNIFVGSDGSSDKTVDVVRSLGAHADDIQPNRGKAGALSYVIAQNDLLKRYRAVFLIDADIHVDKDFFVHTLPEFDDPRIAAVSGYFVAIWPRHYLPRWELLVTAYRIRLWRVLQFFIRYGQTWRHLNMSPIIPGGGSIYRSSVLEKIEINAPGLVIEDFNMTFEVHHQDLGKISFQPRAKLYDQEPYSVRDFVKQIKRWYLGYFQTMRRHGIWPSWFCFFTYLFTLELVASSVLFLLAPFFLLELLMSGRDILLVDLSLLGLSGYAVTMGGLLFSVIIVDFLVTLGVALIERKPLLLLYGMLFFPLRYLESLVFLWMIPMAFITKSTGSWKSPRRLIFEHKK